MALNGDMQALKLLIVRLIPARKDRLVKLNLPKIQSAQDIINIMSLIVENVGKSELEPEQAKALATILEINRKSLETAEIEERLLTLERRGQSLMNRLRKRIGEVEKSIGNIVDLVPGKILKEALKDDLSISGNFESDK
jgi:hypothetical protein